MKRGKVKSAHRVSLDQSTFLLTLTGFTTLGQASTYRTTFYVARSHFTKPDQFRF